LEWLAEELGEREWSSRRCLVHGRQQQEEEGCQRFRSAQLTGVSTPVVYLFGGVKSRAKNSKVVQEHTEHKGHNEFILVRASEE
jgi:hypothetical protein